MGTRKSYERNEREHEDGAWHARVVPRGG
jgi:hypothetical protein